MEDTSTAKRFDFDRLYKKLILPTFTRIDQQDHRRQNKSYTLSDGLKSAFAMYSLKSASLFSFRPKTEAEEGNLKSIYGINQIPSDNGLRKLLDGVDSSKIGSIFGRIFEYLKEEKVLDDYRYFDGHIIASIDGVEHYCSKKINCKHCMSRQHRDGSISYYHSMLSAAIVCPGKSAVFIMENEPMINQDGAKKNDCERNAAHRLLDRMSSVYSSEPIVYVMDGLYACAPILRLITEASSAWKYVINCKENGNKYLFEQFDQLNDNGQVQWKTVRRKEGRYEVGYVSNLSINKSNKEVKTNMVYVNFRNKKGVEKVFSWITNIEPTKKNVMQIVEIGRSRWKIENEVFNTLKNQEYNFEHNFGHGQNYLATNFAFLMMLAFTIDQIQQYGSRVFKSIWSGLKTKIALWDAVRVIFKMVPCKSMMELHNKALEIYQLQLLRI